MGALPQAPLFFLLVLPFQLVGSAPNFPTGTVDNIMAVSELGRKYGIPVHVDCCLGGFLVPFMVDAGYSIPAFDFQLPGVTSVSCDTHKVKRKGHKLLLVGDQNELLNF